MVKLQGASSVVVTYLLVLTIGWAPVEADEVPAFFLKIAKNIPRVGRSDAEVQQYSIIRPPATPRPGNIPRIGKRDQRSRPSLADYINEEGVRGPYKRMVNLQSPGNLEATSWEHFPLAIEGPPELWRTLASYTNDKYGTSSDDIDNEIWQRKKRKE